MPTPMPSFFRLKTRSEPPWNLPALRLLDRVVDAGVDSLHTARQHALGVAVLVDVDADAPDACVVGRLERAETAAACDLEEHLRALGDLVLRDRLALVGRDEVVRVLHEHLQPGAILWTQYL